MVLLSALVILGAACVGRSAENLPVVHEQLPTSTLPEIASTPTITVTPSPTRTPTIPPTSTVTPALTPTTTETLVPTPLGGGALLFSYDKTYLVRSDGTTVVLFDALGVVSHRGDRILSGPETIDRYGNKVWVGIYGYASYLTWSPDDSKILSSTTQVRTGKSYAFIVNSDGSELTRLSCLDSYAFTEWAKFWPIGWMPDGQRILVVMSDYSNSDRLDKWVIFSLKPDCSDVQVLCEAHPANLPIKLSPDGSLMGWWDTNEFYLVRLDQPERIQVSPALGDFFLYSSWAPDNQSIVTSGYPMAFTYTEDGIYLLDIDPVSVNQVLEYGYFPVWSPDGTRIAFLSSVGGTMEVYVMNADGSNVIQLTNTGFPASDGFFLDWLPFSPAP